MITPTGPLSLPLANLQSLVAHCATWQSWIGGSEGAASFERALARVFLIEPTKPETGIVYTDKELIELRPYMWVDFWVPPISRAGDEFRPTRIGLGSYRYSGRLKMQIQDNVAEENAGNTLDAVLAFTNLVGALAEEMLEKAAVADYLSETEIAAGLGGILIRELELYDSIARSDRSKIATQGDYMDCGLVIDYGR